MLPYLSLRMEAGFSHSVLYVSGQSTRIDQSELVPSTFPLVERWGKVDERKNKEMMEDGKRVRGEERLFLHPPSLPSCLVSSLRPDVNSRRPDKEGMGKTGDS